MSLSLILLAAATPPTPPVVTLKELRTGSRLEQSVDYSVSEMKKQQVAIYQREMGECIVHLQGGVSRRLVAASADGAIDFKKAGIAPQKLFDAMSVESCMERVSSRGIGTLWSADYGALHALLVGPLYRSTFDKAPTRDWVRVTAVPVAAIGHPDVVATNRVSGAFGECVARTDFSAADRFVRAEPYSKAENDALGYIKMAIPQCLDEGAKVSMTKDALRRIVADAVWRLAMGTDVLATNTGSK